MIIFGSHAHALYVAQGATVLIFLLLFKTRLFSKPNTPFFKRTLPNDNSVANKPPDNRGEPEKAFMVNPAVTSLKRLLKPEVKTVRFSGQIWVARRFSNVSSMA